MTSSSCLNEALVTPVNTSYGFRDNWVRLLAYHWNTAAGPATCCNDSGGSCDHALPAAQ